MQDCQAVYFERDRLLERVRDLERELMRQSALIQRLEELKHKSQVLDEFTEIKVPRARLEELEAIEEENSMLLDRIRELEQQMGKQSEELGKVKRLSQQELKSVTSERNLLKEKVSDVNFYCLHRSW